MLRNTRVFLSLLNDPGVQFFNTNCISSWCFLLSAIMSNTTISSLQHPLVKHLTKLRKEKIYRNECKSLCIIGEKILAELPSSVPIKQLLITSQVKLPKSIHSDSIYVVTEEILKKITGLAQPEPFVAEVAMPKPGHLEGKNWILCLNGISDPGNLGTLLRTALALGWEGIFLTEPCVDPFNDKALRAAKGATFQLPIQQGSLDELLELQKRGHWYVWIADMEGTALEKASIHLPTLLILGSESHGASPRLKALFPSVTIPMSGKMQSLNVAMAGAILMFELKAK